MDAYASQINALDQAGSVKELVDRLKPILRRLAYNAAMGEATVLEAQENWHEALADALHREGEDDNFGRAKDAPRVGGVVSARAARRTGVPPSLAALMACETFED